MLASNSTPIYEPIVYSFVSWPIILILAPIFLSIFFVPLFKHKKKGIILGSLGVLCCMLIMITGIINANSPKNSAQGRFNSSSIAATIAIKKEVKEQYGLEIIDENVFELVSELGYKGRYYYTPTLKKLSYTKDYDGKVMPIKLQINPTRTEVKVIIPEPVNEAPKVKEAQKAK